MQPYVSADTVGTGSAVALSTILGVKKCKWFQVSGTSITGLPGRVGDANASLDVLSPLSVGRGFPIYAAGGQFSPPVAFTQDFYDLDTWFLVLTIGDTASVGCAV